MTEPERPNKLSAVGECKMCHGKVVKAIRPYHATVEYYCTDCGVMYKFPPFQNPDKKVDTSGRDQTS